MRENKEIVRIVQVLLLCSVLLAPTFLQFSHYIAHHEHKVCDEISTHIHESTVDCFLCEYTPAPLHYLKAEVANVVVPSIPRVTIKEEIPFFFRTTRTATKQLRAPPTFS